MFGNIGWKNISVTLMVIPLITACAQSTPEPTVTTDPGTPLALTAQAATATQEANQIEGTDIARKTEQAVATALAQAEIASTEVAASAGTATEIAKYTEIAELATQKSQDHHATQTAQIEMTKAAGTASAEPMALRVQSLFEEGYIDTTEGKYYALPDFDRSWAQINWYRYWRTERKPSNFVLRTDASWDSASDIANWFNSGCGLVFREDNGENYYYASLRLDGSVRFRRKVNDIVTDIGTAYYGPLGVPEGGAEILLIANHDWIKFFVNGELVHQRQDSALEGGYLAMTLSSGTNSGYGTRCMMKNIDLWELP